MPSKPYNPPVSTLTQSQAQRVALQYVRKPALMVYAYEGKVRDEVHRRRLVSLLATMYETVPRGRGYCLHRSQLKNLAHHIMFQPAAKKAKQCSKIM